MIYLIGSLRNKGVPALSNRLRAQGFTVFDEWYAGGYEADDKWLEYERERGRSYEQALASDYAKNIFEFDKRHLDEASCAVLCAPAGKSAHLELGYMIGRGKPGYVFFPSDPERWDVMYRFATGVCWRFQTLVSCLREGGER